MSIYTKTGDKGKTGLFGGKRVSKYDPQVEAYGSVDEATCFIGFAGEAVTKREDKEALTRIQRDLYLIMTYLSSGPLASAQIEEHLKNLEQMIDRMEGTLAPLTRFVLPQGSEAGSRIHLARVSVRTAERRVAHHLDSKKCEHDDFLILRYLNRLSDFLFTLSRTYIEHQVEAK